MDEFEDFEFNVEVEGLGGGIHEGDEVVDELPGGDFLQEVGSSVLHAGVRQLQSSELDVWVLVVYPPFEGAHGFLGGDLLASDEVAYLEVGGHILQSGGGGLLDLVIEGRCAGPKPPRHDVFLSVTLLTLKQRNKRRRTEGFSINTAVLQVYKTGIGSVGEVGGAYGGDVDEVDGDEREVKLGCGRAI